MASVLWVPLLFVSAFIIMAIGMLLISISALSRYRGQERRIEKNTEVGGVIVLGPIPIAFGTSRRIVKSLLIISIIFFIVVLTVFIMLSGGILVPRY